MYTYYFSFIAIILYCSSSIGFAQDSNPAFAKITDDPNLPRVLLIGDSISIGYTAAVREELNGKANVHRIPTNGGPTFRGLERINEWLGTAKWDVIHFNWGLHDLKYMEDGHHQVLLDQYGLNIERLVNRLKPSGATLIWCSTTPVPEGDVRPKRVPSDVIKYNQAAAAIMKKHGIDIHDLYTFAMNQLSEIQQPVNVHFSKAGSAILGKKVAKEILQYLK